MPPSNIGLVNISSYCANKQRQFSVRSANCQNWTGCYW